MKKIFYFSFLFFFYVQLPCFSQETVTITTFYPAPSGSYQRLSSNYLTFNPQSEAPATPATGMLYWDNGDGQGGVAGFYYRAEGNWNLLAGAGGGGLWTASGGDIYREDGNVGIGTDTPQAKLHVNAGGAVGLRIDTASDDIQMMTQENHVIRFDTAAQDNTGLSFWNNMIGDTIMHIASNGNVGIRKSVPGSALDVAGTITATDITCNNCIGPEAISDGLGIPEIDSTAFQQRVTEPCAIGSSIRVISEIGTVICETDDIGGAGGISSIENQNGPTIDLIEGAGISITSASGSPDTITITNTGVAGSGDKISEGDSEVEVIDGVTGTIEFLADNSKVMEITKAGGVQVYRTASVVGAKSFTVGTGTSDAYAMISGTNAGLEISASSSAEPYVRFSEAGTSKYHIGYPAGSDYLRIGYNPTSEDIMQIYDSDQRVVFPSGSVRIWDGSASVDYATGQGELYVEKDLEVDGNVCLGGNCQSSWPSSLNFYHKYAVSDGGSVAIGGTYELRVTCDNDNDLLFSYHCESDELQTVFSELAYHDSRSGFADGVYCKWKKNSVWGSKNYVWIVCLKDGRNLFGNWGEF